MFEELLPQLTFGDNLRPSQVTRAVRKRLVSRQKRIRQSTIVAVILIALLFNAGLSIVALNSQSELPWRFVLVFDAAAIAAIALTVWSWHARRSVFLQEAPVAPAAVMESNSIALWGIGGLPSWMRRSAQNFTEVLEDAEEGASEEVLHIVKVRLRFRPVGASEQLNWDDLRDEVPHVDVTKWLLSGVWGTFAYGLKRGLLVSLLYAPQKPTDCRIVQAFHSAQSQIEEYKRGSRSS
jgi:hypothetical protein